MPGKKTIAAITTTRADYGHQLPLFRLLDQHPDFNFQLIVTGMHLSQKFGHTIDQIKKDNLPIAYEVATLEDSLPSDDILSPLSSTITKIGVVLKKINPDLFIVFGDRFEMLGAAQAAWFQQIPMAHISGGDISEGSYDNGTRHALTKFSHLHFPSHQKAAGRIRKMGELKSNIHCVGSLSIDLIKSITPLSKEELEADLGFNFQENNMLVTFHPETAGEGEDSRILFEALQSYPDWGIIVTKPNLDSGSDEVFLAIDEFVNSHPNAKAFDSLGQQRYYSTLHYVTMAVGNSSSGLYEVPSFQIPTLNIGNRQKGRLDCDSVFHIPLELQAIVKAIHDHQAGLQKKVSNPYGEGKAAKKIIKVLEKTIFPLGPKEESFS